MFQHGSVAESHFSSISGKSAHPSFHGQPKSSGSEHSILGCKNIGKCEYCRQKMLSMRAGRKGDSQG